MKFHRLPAFFPYTAASTLLSASVPDGSPAGYFSASFIATLST